MYTRASASDYDDWVTKHHNPGWGYKDLLPYLKKVRDSLTILQDNKPTYTLKFETYQIDPTLETHGNDGPLNVSSGGVFGNVGEDFLQVASRYDPQRKFTTDTNGLVSGCNEYGVSSVSVSSDTELIYTCNSTGRSKVTRSSAHHTVHLSFQVGWKGRTKV